MMTKGLGRFEFYLIKLDDLLLQASRSDNPALYLYQNDARTKLFMLEGLSKLYTGLHDKKLFKKLEERFKQLEDLLGQIDYYDSFSKDFLQDPIMPVTIRLFTEEKRDLALAAMNTVLLKRKWINHDPLRTKKIRRKLKKADWKKPEKETALIKAFYQRSIKELNEFYESTGDAFTDLEYQVHSLRRKLRWLSIYPQALQGAIQLSDIAPTDPAIEKYLTPEIVNSPFNKMPDAGNNGSLLMLEKKYFLALSYMISALGKLKDAGLRILITAEAEQATQFLSPEKAMEKALELNGLSSDGLQDIMSNAKKLIEDYQMKINLSKIMAVEIETPEHAEATESEETAKT